MWQCQTYPSQVPWPSCVSCVETKQHKELVKICFSLVLFILELAQFFVSRSKVNLPFILIQRRHLHQ